MAFAIKKNFQQRLMARETPATPPSWQSKLSLMRKRGLWRLQLLFMVGLLRAPSVLIMLLKPSAAGPRGVSCRLTTRRVWWGGRGGGGPMFALANKLTRKFCFCLWSWRSLLGSNEEKYYDLVQIDSCLYCGISPVLMITLQLLGHLDHLRRVHVRHREDHVEDQGDPHRWHRCQCPCRRDWGVQFVFFHIII